MYDNKEQYQLGKQNPNWRKTGQQYCLQTKKEPHD